MLALETLPQVLAMVRRDPERGGRAEATLTDPSLPRHDAAAEVPGSLGLPRARRDRVAAALFDDVSAGEFLGRFRILRRVGRGGMGTVFEAHDPNLDRRVAIKLHEGSSPELRARLLQEAHALARLSHPNVVQVFETGEADERLFIVMELVRGSSLKDWQTQPRPWRECVQVYEQAARGLAAAHAAEIVHRDFKPANCIIDDAGHVKVLDFGLASGWTHAGTEATDGGDATRRDAAPPQPSGAGAVSSTNPLRTRTGAVLGTPAYMAPEQAMGERSDARADQFSFCVSLYEAIHGVRPFQGMVAAQSADTPKFEPSAAHVALLRIPAIGNAGIGPS